MPMVRVRGGPTLTLTSNKHMPASRDSHSSQSSMRSHTFQSIQPRLPIVPSLAFYGNRSGRYSPRFQPSQGRQATSLGILDGNTDVTMMNTLTRMAGVGMIPTAGNR